MWSRVRFLSPLFVLAALISAGCPVDSGQDLLRTTGSGNASDPNSQLVGPPSSGNAADPNAASTTDASSSIPTLTAGASTNTPSDSVSDALTIRYAGCLDPAEGSFWRAEILRLVNQERTSRGVPAVAQNPTLEREATQYACEMISYQFFDHVDPVTGTHLKDRADQFGYDYWIIGENLAAGQRSPAEAVQAWMNSPCHRQNVLNPAFTELGIGVRVGGDYGFYWVQEFGRPYSIGVYPGLPYHDPDCTQTE